MVDVYKVSTLGRNPDGEPFMTSFNYVAEGGVTDQQVADAFALAVDNNFADGLDERTVAAFHIDGVKVSRFDSATEEVLSTAESPLTIAGTGDGALPSQVALVASLRTPIAGRSYRGRMYWGGFGNGQVTNTGEVQPGLVTTLRDFVRDVFVDGVADLGEGEIVVYSPTLHTFTAVNQIAVGNAFDTQRRRANRRVETYSTVSI